MNGPGNAKTIWSWALYDFANSIFPAVMLTAVFPVFFQSYIVEGEAGVGELLWGRSVSISALIVALTAPLLGVLADRSGLRKRFLIGYALTCVLAVYAMTVLAPGMAVLAMVLFIFANVGFEGSLVFYNAYLPEIAAPERQGWVSGLGFGVGYIGSALGLLLVIPFVPDRMPLVWVTVATFFLVFSLPAFKNLPPDRRAPGRMRDIVVDGLADFKRVALDVLSLRDLRNFLIAYFFYIDGVLTIIVMAGLIATTTFGFTQEQTIILFLLVQLSALVGALALGRPTDTFGPKLVLLGVLSVWVAVGIAAFFVESVTTFYGLAVAAGLGLGSTQAASRAYVAQLIPKGRETEIFGFYALCGKTSSILGPALFGFITYMANGNQRPGFLLLTVLFLVGGLLLLRVRDPSRRTAGAAS